jgi:hypothetical protein
VSVDPGAEIQDGVDIVDVTGGTVNVGAGTYVEDLSIDTDNVELAGAGVGSSIVQGVANVDEASFPLAVPNIDVRGDGVRIHDFTLRGPDPVAGRYASGMVIGGNNVEIDRNAFEVTNAATFDEISQGIQTYRDGNNPRAGNDLSGLNIHDNSFAAHGAAPGPTEAGYEGIFLNHTTGDPTPGPVTIADNSFSGPVLRGITTERSNVAITGNTIETTLTPIDGGAVAGDAFQGILVQDFGGRVQQDVTVTGNTVGGDAGAPGSGFSQGIRVGAVGQVMTGIAVSGNTLNGNDLQVQDRAGVLTIADVFAGNSFDRSVIVEGGDTVFSKVQDGIDAAPAGVDAANPTGISVGNGTYVEDLAITTNNLDLAGAGAGSTTIQGVATSSQASFPLAAPNIDIRADGVAVHGFTVASPDLSPVAGVDQRSDGLVLKGTGIEIYDNTFQMNQSVADVAVEAGGNTSVAIQTWRDSNPDAVASNVNGLRIHDNTFQGTPSDGYYGVFVNQQGSPVSAADADAVKIADNTFTGTIWRAISTERSNTDITGNTITTDTDPGVFGSNSGVMVANFSSNAIDDVTVTGNAIGGGDAGHGFGDDVRLGFPGVPGTLSNLTVSGNGTAAVRLRGTATLDGVDVMTDGAVVEVTDDVTLGAGGLSVATNGGAPAGAEIIIGGKVDGTAPGTGVLVLDPGTFAATLSDAVGSAATLASVEMKGASLLEGGSVASSGTQTYSGATTLGQNTTLEGTDVTFGHRVDGAFDLTVTASGATRFEGLVGSVTPLASLATDGGGTTVFGAPGSTAIPTVETTGIQDYVDAVTLESTSVLQGSEIDVRSTLAAGSNDATFVADEIDFTGGADSSRRRRPPPSTWARRSAGPEPSTSARRTSRRSRTASARLRSAAVTRERWSSARRSSATTSRSRAVP